MSILKNIVAPIQARVLEKHMCPGCTRNLNKQKKREPITTETELVRCECGRVFVYLRPHRRYRRAIKEEIRQR